MAKTPAEMTDPRRAKAMAAIKIQILAEHLLYELDMLEGALTFLHAPESADQRKNAFLQNATIECFWTHARTIVEFLTHPSSAVPAGTVSARDFTHQYFPDMRMKSMDQRINAQISHLTYERKSSAAEKLDGFAMLRAKRAIDSEIRRFEEHMLPEYREVWTPRKPSQGSTVDAATVFASQPTTSTASIQTMPELCSAPSTCRKARSSSMRRSRSQTNPHIPSS